MGHGGYDRMCRIGLLQRILYFVLFRVGASSGTIERGIGPDDYGGIGRRFGYALYGGYRGYVRAGGWPDAIINMYVVYRIYIIKNTIR